jgi:methylase of polypeptide subunit release factors
MKKIGKAAAFLIGTGFIAIQTAQHLGYVNVSWTDVHKKAITALDTNSDGEFDKVSNTT